ncbi:DUF6986 family protein [Williamsia phyllosphaerae]|uniref:Aldolase n=1 Tax=Williamsia phyllosphaerae TaxID=885042 RepID=A0ABQ1V891_9NOCA|nr:aldolase/citrate lyase family protein [Williamsia phyllosphaerae]GGF43781.1 aldolase [Williamsia phyllosphaerae]
MTDGTDTTGLRARAQARMDDLLREVDAELAAGYPDSRAETQPVHTVYVPADAVGPDTLDEWGARAVELAESARPTLVELSSESAVDTALTRLRTAPIEDLRIDLEDGYGWRDDAVEDRHARAAGAVLAQWSATGSGPRLSSGVRCKGLGPVERNRGLRTMEAVLDGAGGVPDGFVFTVPKLRAVAQVDAVIALCEEIERAHGLAPMTVRFELQIESPQAVVGASGAATVAQAIHRSGPRLSGLHYGTYDYSAACGIVSAYQSLEHPVADHAKAVMLASAAQTGVWVCDGSTQIIPTGDAAQVDAALRRHHRLVRRSLERGFYQGWDMHPGHLVTRWLAVQTFFADAMPAAAARLQRYLERTVGDGTTDATDGGVMDEPATARALAGVLVRGWGVDAFEPAHVTAIGPLCTPERVAPLAGG